MHETVHSLKLPRVYIINAVYTYYYMYTLWCIGIYLGSWVLKGIRVYVYGYVM